MSVDPPAPAGLAHARKAPSKPPLPRIYRLPLIPAGGLEDARRHFARAADLGFDAVLLAPLLRAGPAGDPAAPLDHGALAEALGGGRSRDTLAALKRGAAGLGLRLFLDLAPERFDAAHPAVAAAPFAFSIARARWSEGPVDPRRPPNLAAVATARLHDEKAFDALRPTICAMLEDLRAAGLDGFRILAPTAAPAKVWRALLDPLRAEDPLLFVLAEMAGVPRGEALALRGAGFDAMTSSLPYWNGRDPWLVEEHAALRAAAPVLPVVEPASKAFRRPAGEAGARALSRTLALAGALGGGLLMPLGAEYGAAAQRAADDEPAAPDAPWRGADPPVLAAEVRQATAAAARPPVEELLQATGPGRAVTILAARRAGPEAAELILVNPALERTAEPGAVLPAGLELVPVGGASSLLGLLGPGEVRTAPARRPAPAPAPPPPPPAEAAGAPRVVIDALSPLVAGGAFAAKRVAGEVLLVEADAFSDGHDALGVELQWRWAGEEVWRGERMAALGNDRWSGALPLDRIGRAAWRIEAWIDRFAGARSDLEKRIAAGVAGPMDLEEAVRLVEAAAEGLGSGRTDLSLRKGLRALGKALRRAAPEEVKALLLAPETAALMSRADTRPFAARSAEQAVETDRLRARFASWYELFPRSQAREAGRHGDFDDVIERLPAIRDMGFDVVYFPPIHPIGLSHRKGPDNSLTAGPGDPGSPYAIGSPEGGHDAVHPDLGGLAAFRRLMAAATALGLEVALDFAIQCSPDHPWLTSRPGWFAWRPDGSLRCAENPPKRYEDIVNVDFYAAEAVPALWAALRDVVLFWIGEGVRTFRVDNPHTKPLPFWRWMIADVRARHPETLFLSEAFTRPKMMYRLAKEGFSQSYTYFTWRERKEELEAYLLELADGPPREFFRPHFFVNTPDINPSFLQRSGRAGFLIRAALAATLSGLFGVYSGFELLEADPIPGKEEYLHSEKFELRQRDWTGEPNIIAEISLLNRLRRANPALQTHLGVAFHPAANDNVLFFSKGAPGADLVLVAISLNPHGAEACDVEVPLWRLGLEGDAAVGAIDLVTEETFVWRGARQWLRLEPERPFALWRLAGEVAR